MIFRQAKASYLNGFLRIDVPQAVESALETRQAGGRRGKINASEYFPAGGNLTIGWCDHDFARHRIY